MRHAFDADHIATIDNTTRKLLHDGTRPHATGFFFSAGHSTVVFLLAVVVALGVRGVGDAVADEGSTLHQVTSVWGPTVAGLFLLVVGLVNLGVVRQTLALAGARATASSTPRSSPAWPADAARSARSRAAWLGASRGPGSSTPSGSRSGSGSTRPPRSRCSCWPRQCRERTADRRHPLPADPLRRRMTLLDTLNGAATARAYSWALNAPARRVAYNVAVTGVSVLFALASAP